MCHHQETQMSSGLGELYFSKPLKDAGFLKLWRDLCVTPILQKEMELVVEEKNAIEKTLL